MSPFELIAAYRWTVAWWVAIGYGVGACAVTIPRPFG